MPTQPIRTQQLYELQHRLEATQDFWSTEVEAFCKYFYAPKEKQSITDQAEMYRELGPAIDRFKAKDVDQQDEFRNALSGYVKLYSFLSQVMPFSDPDLEKLYTFGRFLELKLPKDEKKAPLNLDGDVALKYYRLDKILEGQIRLAAAEPVALKAPTAVGTRQAKDVEAPLSEIIDVLNERFGTEFTQADQLLFDQFVQQAKEDHDVVERAMANPLDNFELAMKPKVETLMIDRMDQNQEIVNRYLNDPTFQSVAFKAIVKRVRGDPQGGRAHSAADQTLRRARSWPGCYQGVPERSKTTYDESEQRPPPAAVGLATTHAGSPAPRAGAEP